MKKNIIEAGRLFKIGLSFGVALSLVSCAGDQPTASAETEVMDEEISVRADETGEFGGNVNEMYNDMFYRDFSASAYYEDWDMNDDDLIDENEYSAAFFDTWDLNDDDILDENEWNSARSDFGFSNDTNWEWEAWDTDRDKKINQEEFSMQLGNSNLFRDWDKDTDNMLSKKEYSDGIVSLWGDADGDGVMDDKEYKEKYKKYYKKDKMKHKHDMKHKDKKY